jgi:hypothetical protein
MANNSTLRKVFCEVECIIDEKYRWIGVEHEPSDYFDWGMSYKITADDIIAAMIEEGDLEAAE